MNGKFVRMYIYSICRRTAKAAHSTPSAAPSPVPGSTRSLLHHYPVSPRGENKTHIQFTPQALQQPTQLCRDVATCTPRRDVHFRSSIIEIEGWRADREGWCARTDATMESLAEDSRVLTRRCQTQHQAIGELGDRITQADLSAAVGATLKAAETATATALAPVRVRCRQQPCPCSWFV